MMSSEEDTFIMPVTLKAHQCANQFWQQQPNPEKAKQIYLNTLAVQAVQAYLSWFDIETDLETSDSWSPAIQALADTADLVVKGQGKLECRPVLPNEQVCRVPPEVWQERIGYVAVQFNTELSEATLLGFVSSVEAAEVPLSQLRSLTDLLDQLNPDKLSPPESDSKQATIHLGQWLQGVVDTGWQTIDTLLGLPQPALSFRMAEERGGYSMVTENAVLSALPQAPLQPMTRGKLLDWDASEVEPIALLVGVTPTDKPDYNIQVTLCPTADQTHLPPDLDVMVLDATGVPVMQAQSRSTEMIQLKFSGIPGEQFSVKVILAHESVLEHFVI